MKKATRFRVDQGDADRHVGQNFSLKLTSRSIDALLRLTSVKSPGQDGSDQNTGDQPAGRHGNFAQQIVNRSIGNLLGWWIIASHGVDSSGSKE